SDFTVAALFERIADTVPERTAVLTPDAALSYAALDERASRFAHYLLDVGVQPGDHVGIHAYNRPEWCEAMLGCYKARAVPINVNYRYVPEELRYLFDNADLAALVSESSCGAPIASVLPGLPKLHHLIPLDDGTPLAAELGAVAYEDALRMSSPARDSPPRSPDDLYILYTGGTTGMP